MEVQASGKPRENGHGKGSYKGVVELFGNKQLPQEFITIGSNFQEALGRCRLRDEEQKNAVVIYKAQLEMFEMWDELEDLTNWLNASTAVGGFNSSLAAMTYTGVYVPEGAGIKMSKESQKTMRELQKVREMQNMNDRNNKEGNQ